jgi:hypothetical protein
MDTWHTSSSPKFTNCNSLFHVYFALTAITPSVSLHITSSLHFLFNILIILMMSVSVYFYSMLLPTATLKLFCSMSTFHWAQCLYEVLGHHNSSNAMSEKPAIFPQTRGHQQFSLRFCSEIGTNHFAAMCQSGSMCGPTSVLSIFNLMVTSIVIKYILAHVHL